MGQQRIEVKVHRHGRPVLDITPTVTSLVWLKSISAPWQSLTVTWKATVKDAFALVSVGDWVTIRAPSPGSRGANDGMSLSLCHIDTIDSSVMNSGGALQTGPITMTATSWWNLLNKTALYSPLGYTDDIGTLLSMTTWSSAVAAATGDYVVGSLGVSFQKLFSLLAAVELPETLGGKKLADIIPIVYDDTTRQKYAPDRVIESVDIGGGTPKRFTSNMGPIEATVGEILTGAFVPESLLFELFPSFEPFPASTAQPTGTVTPDPPTAEASGPYSGRFAETSDFSDPNSPASDGTPPVNKPPLRAQLPEANATLASLLGGWETLIYRVKPFRTRPLRESVVAWAQYQHRGVEAEVAASLLDAFGFNRIKDVIDGASLLNSLGFNRIKDAIVEDTQNKFAESSDVLLNKVFEQVTWNYTTAKFIDKHHIRSVSFNRNDQTRLNASSIVLSPDPSTGIEALKQIGLPITYDEEIIRHGLRMLKPAWTFTIRSPELKDDSGKRLGPLPPPADPNYFAYLRSICAQFMQFYKNNHLFSTGEIALNLLDATALREKEGRTYYEKMLYLKQGETVVLRMHNNTDLFYCYVDTIKHTFIIQDGGVEAAATVISYSRGHFGVSDDALVNSVDVPMRQATQPSKQVGIQTGQVSEAPRIKYADKPLNKPADDFGTYILVNGIKEPTDFNVIHSYIDLSNPRLPSGVVLPRSTMATTKLAILHYEGINNISPSCQSLKGYFEQSYLRYAGEASDLGSVHFAIDYNGAVWQYLDCAIVACHAGPSAIQVELDGNRISPNPFSIGIGFINPTFERSAATSPPEVRAKWSVVSSPWYTKSSKGKREQTNFLVPTSAQLASCRQLLLALPTVGVPITLTTSADPTEEGTNTIRRLRYDEKKQLLTTGGVYHHLQWEANRFDSCGVDIRSLLS